jgi:flavin reductase (DIM6/NTAB) family NADH-FMN oxidoreductase RutF
MPPDNQPPGNQPPDAAQPADNRRAANRPAVAPSGGHRPAGHVIPAGFADALGSWPAAVTLLTVADGRDDIGTTVSAFCPVSADPSLVLVSLIATSYPAEVLGRVDRFAVTLLAARQRALAGRFAAAGRPGARLLLANVPHHRGEISGALIPDGGLAAFECAVTTRVLAGDHVLIVASVLAVPYVAASGEPLIRFRGGYLR